MHLVLYRRASGIAQGPRSFCLHADTNECSKSAAFHTELIESAARHHSFDGRSTCYSPLGSRRLCSSLNQQISAPQTRRSYTPMPNPIHALAANIDDQSRPETARFGQDRELIVVTAFCVIGLFVALLFALWAPLSNEAATVFLTAIPSSSVPASATL